MIQQKQKPNKEKLKIKDVTITTKNMNPDYAQRKIDNVKNLPQVYYYDVELQSQAITKLVIDSNKFMPLCYVCYNDTYNIMHDIGFPSDNAKLTVVIPSNHGALANIFMEFKIQRYSVELLRGSTAKKIHMWGICSTENLLVTQYKSYDKKTSFDLMKETAIDCGLGLMSNVDSSSDAMTWLNPGQEVHRFLQDVANKAWVGETGFVWSFVDFFYNLNYINIENSLSEDINKISWVNTNIMNNKMITDIGESNKTIAPTLTNENSQKGSNVYFTGEKILNQSTDISLKRGYLRNVNFYDIDGNWGDKAGAYKKYGLDTITSPGSQSNAIYLKGEPGDTDFYSKNIKNHYLDKIDTKNMYPDFLWAKLQNIENLQDLQKIAMQIVLPIPNFNIKRFEKIRLLFTNNSLGVKANQRNVKLNGEWLVTGVKYEWNGKSLYQFVNIVKRELTIGEI
jgi:hypothetical protein